MCRTTPDISNLLRKLEYRVQESFIPVILNRAFCCDDILRKIFSLPARDGGLGLYDISAISDAEYKYSVMLTQQLTKALYDQDHEYYEDQENLQKIKESVTKERT